MDKKCFSPLLFAIICSVFVGLCFESKLVAAEGISPLHRSPIDVTIIGARNNLVSANQLANSLSLIDSVTGKVLDEISCGNRPVQIVNCLTGNHVAVTCSDSAEIFLAEVQDKKFGPSRSIHIGFLPTSITVSKDGSRAWVGLDATGEVAEVDLANEKVIRKFPVGAWPRSIAVSSDDQTLAVGCSGESAIHIVDLKTEEVTHRSKLIGGINMGHLELSEDGSTVYFPWMVYRNNPITRQNIQLGWVLASRIGRLPFEGEAYREAISLDVPRKAVADPYGIALSHKTGLMSVTSSGTHELLVYRTEGVPFVGVGGPGDLIDRSLMRDPDLFTRIPLGGRPMGVVLSPDEKTLYVANYLKDSIQVVDLESRQFLREFALGSPPEISLARQGMEIFYDGQRSFDQWYSCHSCHQDGGTNARAMDTHNDGSDLTMKTVIPLYQVHETGPWTWHGWQQKLTDGLQKSFTSTMLGTELTPKESEAVMAYLESQTLPPNPFPFDEAAQRGQQLFHQEKVGCSNCHSGPNFTDGEIHEVGTGSPQDVYSGYNTPSLRGIYRRVRYLHDGRSKSLQDVLKTYHSPAEVIGGAELTEEQISDLIAYLKTL